MIIEAEVEEIGRCIEETQRELAAITSDSGGNPETVAALKSIKEHLAKAAGRHSELHKECYKTSVDGKVSMQSCADITKHLESAMTEHTALVLSLEDQEPSKEDSSTALHQHK